MKTILALLILTFSVTTFSQKDDGLTQFLQAGEAYARGDYPTAIRLVQPLAEAGNAAAQYNLGTMYREGKGVAPDDTAAREWF